MPSIWNVFIKFCWHDEKLTSVYYVHILLLEQIIDDNSCMYLFIGSPTTSTTPCPGGVALEDDGSCPTFTCDDNCLNGGICKNGKCECVGAFKGIDCALFECTDTPSCNNVGTCDSSTKKCTCNPGFSGVDCNITGRKTLNTDKANPQVLKDLSEITHF